MAPSTNRREASTRTTAAMVTQLLAEAIDQEREGKGDCSAREERRDQAAHQDRCEMQWRMRSDERPHERDRNHHHRQHFPDETFHPGGAVEQRGGNRLAAAGAGDRLRWKRKAPDLAEERQRAM